VNDADMGLIGGLFTLVGAAISLIWGYLSDKGNRKSLFTYSVFMIPWGAIPFFLAKFLNENKGFTIQQATTIFLVFGIGITIGTIIGGMLGGELVKKKALFLPQFCAVTTALGAALALVLFTFMPSGSFGWSMIIGFLASFLVAMTGPNVRTMLLETNVPENRGAIFSLFNLTDSAGAGIGKFIGGNLSVAFGLSFALNASAAIWIPCAILFWVGSTVFPDDIKRFQQKISMVAQR
jgi:predicted MFS family arabinose efflux permease